MSRSSWNGCDSRIRACSVLVNGAMGPESSGSKLYPCPIDPEQDLNDYSNAERLATAIAAGSWARYVPGRGWFYWDGQRYAPGLDWVMREAAAEARRLFGIAAGIPDEKLRGTVLKHANSSLRSERLSAAVNLAATIGGVKLEARYCDAMPEILGVTNGIVDLGLGEFDVEYEQNMGSSPFTRDFVTLQAGCEYYSSAQCPNWRNFLESVFDGDAELIAYVQRAVGYSLSGYTSEHVLFFLYGSGANGKSVFVNVLKALFGEYSAVISSETLLARKNGQQTNDLARLPGRRVVIASELEDGARWNESLVKSLTGGDPISARFLYAEFFEFIPVFKLFVVGNHRPVVRGTDEGIWRRLQLIPFNVFFPPEKRDRELTEKLIQELPGILNWAIDGYLLWRESGLNPPASVLDATAAYRSDEDRVGTFIDECCEIDASLSVQASALYKAYHAWAQRRGETPLSMTRFGGRLAERGLRKMKSGFVSYQGIWLRQRDEAEKPPSGADS